MLSEREKKILAYLQNRKASRKEIMKQFHLTKKQFEREIKVLYRTHHLIDRLQKGLYTVSVEGQRQFQISTLAASNTGNAHLVLKAKINLFPTQAQRSLIWMYLYAVVGKKLYFFEFNYYPTFFMLGDTGHMKTAMMRFVCLALGLNHFKYIHQANQKTAAEMLARRSPKKGGGYELISLYLEDPLIVIDDLDKLKSRELREGIFSYAHGEREYPAEKSSLLMRVCPMFISNEKTPEELNIHFAIQRRSIFLNTWPLDDIIQQQDTIKIRRKILEAPPLIPPTDLDKLAVSAQKYQLSEEQKDLLSSLIKQGIKKEFFGKRIDVPPLYPIVLGCLALGGASSIEEAVYQIAYHRLNLAATEGITKTGWQQLLYERWTKYRKENNIPEGTEPEIENKVTEELKVKEDTAKATTEEAATTGEEERGGEFVEKRAVLEAEIADARAKIHSLGTDETNIRAKGLQEKLGYDQDTVHKIRMGDWDTLTHWEEKVPELKKEVAELLEKTQEEKMRETDKNFTEEMRIIKAWSPRFNKLKDIIATHLDWLQKPQNKEYYSSRLSLGEKQMLGQSIAVLQKLIGELNQTKRGDDQYLALLEKQTEGCFKEFVEPLKEATKRVEALDLTEKTLTLAEKTTSLDDLDKISFDKSPLTQDQISKIEVAIGNKRTFFLKELRDKLVSYLQNTQYPEGDFTPHLLRLNFLKKEGDYFKDTSGQIYKLDAFDFARLQFYDKDDAKCKALTLLTGVKRMTVQEQRAEADRQEQSRKNWKAATEKIKKTAEEAIPLAVAGGIIYGINQLTKEKAQAPEGQKAPIGEGYIHTRIGSTKVKIWKKNGDNFYVSWWDGKKEWYGWEKDVKNATVK